MENTLQNTISQALSKQGFTDFQITIENISHLHAGHFNGNENSHFNIKVACQELKNLSPLQRHKILNSSIQELLNNQTIHAVSFSVK